MPRRLTASEFIGRSVTTHGDYYDYSLVEYVSVDVPVSIICPQHGVFTQAPDGHMNGKGCRSCGYDRVSNSLRCAVDDVLSRAKIVHGSRYVYDMSDYVDTRSKILITCKRHGEFYQQMNHHLNGSGCPSCANDDRLRAMFGDEWGRMDTGMFIRRSSTVHDGKYMYDDSVYVDSKTKVKIQCPNHGGFYQDAQTHLSGHGCPACGRNTRQITVLDFIRRARAFHGKKYGYEKVVQSKVRDKVIITCPDHGDFSQVVHSHLGGNGCPLCIRKSRGEDYIVGLLNDLSIEYEREKRFSDCRHKLPLRFDFYLPKYSTLLEFDGAQHFRPISRFGGEEAFIESVARDEAKNAFAKDNGIILLRFVLSDIYSGQIRDRILQLEEAGMGVSNG